MREVPQVESGADAFGTLVQLDGTGGRNAIVRQNGEFVRVLSEADYARAMTVQRGFRSGFSG